MSGLGTLQEPSKPRSRSRWEDAEISRRRAQYHMGHVSRMRSEFRRASLERRKSSGCSGDFGRSQRKRNETTCAALAHSTRRPFLVNARPLVQGQVSLPSGQRTAMRRPVQPASWQQREPPVVRPVCLPSRLLTGVPLGMFTDFRFSSAAGPDDHAGHAGEIDPDDPGPLLCVWRATGGGNGGLLNVAWSRA